MLPTPTARLGDSRGASHPDRRKELDSRRSGELDEVAVHVLLPTPEAKLGSSGPDYARAGRDHGDGGGGDDLTTAVHRALLPTPRATDGTKGGPNQRGSSGDLMLPSAVQSLLPTPRATRGGSATETTEALLLPTPSVADGMGGHLTRSGARSDELLLPGVAKSLTEGQNPPPVQLLPTPVVTDAASSARHTTTTGVAHPGTSLTDAIRGQNWGAYGPAIRRWEAVLGRPAPAPTELGAKCTPRLSPAFVEWMMGLPAGHVTDPAIGISRNEQLKALGNGVVPQQCAAALRAFLADYAAAGPA